MRKLASFLSSVVILTGLVFSTVRAQPGPQPSEPDVYGSNEAVGELHSALETSRAAVENLRTRVLDNPSDIEADCLYLRAHMALVETLIRMHTDFIQEAAEEGAFFNALRDLTERQERQIAEAGVEEELFRRKGDWESAKQMRDLGEQGERWLQQLVEAQGVLVKQLAWARNRRNELKVSLTKAEKQLAQCEIYRASLNKMADIMAEFASTRTSPPPLLAPRPLVEKHTLTPPPPSPVVP